MLQFIILDSFVALRIRVVATELIKIAEKQLAINEYLVENMHQLLSMVDGRYVRPLSTKLKSRDPTLMPRYIHIGYLKTLDAVWSDFVVFRGEDSSLMR